MIMIVFRKNIWLRNLSIICLLGNMLYFLFPFPPIIWRGFSVLIYVVCCVCSLNQYKLTFFERMLMGFAGLNLLYFLVSYIWMEPSTTQLGNTLVAILSFNTFIYLGSHGVLTDKFLTITTIGIVVAGALYFNHIRLETLLLYSNLETVTINASVVFLMLMPAVFLLKNKLISIVVFCIILFYIIIAAKRGNVLAIIIPTLFYIYSLLKDSKRSFVKTTIVFVAIVAIANWGYDLVVSNDYLQKRIEETKEGSSSGRDVIYEEAWDEWYNSSKMINIVLGYGYDGTIKQIHKRAHNDWLELLVDNGMLGIIVYFILFCSFATIIRHEKDFLQKVVLLSVFLIWFFKTTYSMAFTEEFLGILAIPVGMIIGRYRITNDRTEL